MNYTCEICDKPITRTECYSRVTKNQVSKNVGECAECAEQFTDMFVRGLNYFYNKDLLQDKKEVI